MTDSYKLYKIEDLSAATSIKDDDLLILNVLNSIGGGYVSGRLSIKGLIDHFKDQGVGASVLLGDAEPSNPQEGDLWWNTNDNTLYVYYDDGNTQQWVISVPQGGGQPGDPTNIDGGTAGTIFRGISNVSGANNVSNLPVINSLPSSGVSGDMANVNGVLYFHDGTSFKAVSLS